MPKKIKGKKVKGKKKGKGKKKAKVKEGPTAEQKLQNAVEQMQKIQDQLTIRTQMQRDAKETCQRLRFEVHEMVEDLQAEQFDKRELTSDLTRQYKSMQLHLGMKIQEGEASISQLQRDLSDAQAQLVMVRQQNETLLKEKEELQEQLHKQAATMEQDYEQIILDALNQLMTEVDGMHKNWHKEALAGSQRLRQILLEFAHDGELPDERCRSLYQLKTSEQFVMSEMDALSDEDSSLMSDGMTSDGYSMMSERTDFDY